MRAAIIATLVLPVIAVSAAAQAADPNSSISVTFAVDGKPVACDKLKVQLRLGGRSIVPKRSGQGFTVPAVFNKKALPDDTVDASVSCGEYALRFPKLHRTWVRPGSWEIGVAYPPYWMDRFGGTTAVEQGAWLSYLEFECNECDPAVFTTISHPTPPASILAGLRREQPSASGERARDIAYALAVFNSEYQQNRDYLLGLMNSCLARSKDSLEDDECDGKLLHYVTNLYWRGDIGLLAPLLQIADIRHDVIFEIGTFYAHLLDRHTAAAVSEMQVLSVAKQATICPLAGEDDFSLDSPKFKRVAEHLHSIGGEVAERCLREAESAARRAL